MFHPIITEMMAEDRQQCFLDEAMMHRQLQDAGPSGYQRMLLRLGEHLIAWGTRLQRRYEPAVRLNVESTVRPAGL